MKKLLTGAILITSIFMAGCKGGGSGDPKTVLISFFDALAKKDIAGARKLATKESKDMLDMMEMGTKMGGDKKEDDKYNKEKMEFGDAKIDGDKATVAVKDKTSNESTNFTLKKESGDWKVAFDKASMMNMGMDKMKEKGISTDSLTNGLDKMKEGVDSLSNKMKESLENAVDSVKKTGE